MSVSLVISQGKISMRAWRELQSERVLWATRCRSSMLRDARIRFAAPASAKEWAICSPIPELAPMMQMVRGAGRGLLVGVVEGARVEWRVGVMVFIFGGVGERFWVE